VGPPLVRRHEPEVDHRVGPAAGRGLDEAVLDADDLDALVHDDVRRVGVRDVAALEQEERVLEVLHVLEAERAPDDVQQLADVGPVVAAAVGVHAHLLRDAPEPLDGALHVRALGLVRELREKGDVLVAS
jgi:hypothetical protein